VAERRQEKSFDRPKVEMRADERMLLNALFLSPELCGEILPELKSIEAITRFSSRRIFQTVFAIDASGGRVTFEEVNARLEEADQNLLAEAVLREDAEPSREEVLAAVGSMRRTEDQQNRVQLKLKIREAERAGNWEQALRFTEELQRVERAAREPR